jgi:L-Ala-D/L-Glu epimerase
MEKRRTFIKHAGMAAGALILPGMTPEYEVPSKKTKNRKKMPLTLRFRPYDLKLKHVFTIATNSRTTTPDILTELEWNGVVGYGEASLPPYLTENQDSVSKFLSSLDLSGFTDPFLMEDIQDHVDHSAEGNYAAKAAFDIALHDLVGKLIGQPWYKMWGLNPAKTPVTSFTIGIDTPEVVRQKVREAGEFKILKVKLGRDNDKEMVETIRSVTNVPICADANQGWTDRQQALEMCQWLAGKGVVFVEQPMPKTAKEDLAWLTWQSPLPIIGDEGVQTLADVVPASHIYSGINIKLMKCGGLRAARKMITLARALNMKVMIGCMTETSCAVSAAAQLSPLVDWADLDGNLLISNDIYEGSKVENGKIILSSNPGIGIIPLKNK